MTTSDLRGYIKNLTGITTTTYDSQIDTFGLFGLKRLYPMAQNEVDPQTATISVVAGRATVDLSTLGTPLVDARFIEVNNGSDVWYSHRDFAVHGNIMTIDRLDSTITSVKIYGLIKFTLATVPDYLELAVVYYGVSEFFKFILGNKSLYNVYMQNKGADATSDMRSEADYYEALGNQYLQDHATVYGNG